ncbi:MAG: hypothetical protein ACRDRC_09465 [Pseudonocardiaceae bacterium]
MSKPLTFEARSGLNLRRLNNGDDGKVLGIGEEGGIFDPGAGPGFGCEAEGGGTLVGAFAGAVVVTSKIRAPSDRR